MEQGQTEAKHTPEAETLADAILKAAGSGLRHYGMAGTRERIFAAAQQGISDARAELREAALKAIRAIDSYQGAMTDEIAVALAEAKWSMQAAIDAA